MDSDARLTQILNEIGHIAPAILNERQKRLIGGCIAKGYGHGGINVASEVMHLDPRTIRAGKQEIETDETTSLKR